MNIPEISSYYPPFANQNKPQVSNPILQAPTISPSLFQKKEVEYVVGYEGASNYQMAPNSSTLLLDKDMNVLWVVATDQNGNKSVIKGYNIGEEYIPPKPVTLDDLMHQMQSMNDRLTKMEEIGNAKPNFNAVSTSESNGASTSTSSWHGSGNANRNSNGNVKSK